MSVSDVILLEDNTTTRGHIKRGEKAFYGVRLLEGDLLKLSFQMKGDLTLSLFFKNKRLIIKTVRSGIHALSYSATQEGFYQCLCETIEGANFRLDCDIEVPKDRRKGEEASPLRRINLAHVLFILPLFVMPGLALYLYLHVFSLLLSIPALVGVYLLYEMVEDKEVVLAILYASQGVFALLLLFFFYFIMSWQDTARLLLLVIYVTALVLSMAVVHFFFRKVVR